MKTSMPSSTVRSSDEKDDYEEVLRTPDSPLPQDPSHEQLEDFDITGLGPSYGNFRAILSGPVDCDWNQILGWLFAKKYVAMENACCGDKVQVQKVFMDVLRKLSQSLCGRSWSRVSCRSCCLTRRRCQA